MSVSLIEFLSSRMLNIMLSSWFSNIWLSMEFSLEMLANKEQNYYDTSMKLGSFIILSLRNSTTLEDLKYSMDLML
jgi:hypothetical protein